MKSTALYLFALIGLSSLFASFAAPAAAQIGPVPCVCLTAEQQTILSYMSMEYIDDGTGYDAPTIQFCGVNVQIVNCTGTTDGTPNSVGNLIVGYNEAPAAGSYDRTGSHDVVLGMENDHSSFGGFLSGLGGSISASHASVISGLINSSSGEFSVVVGGQQNSISSERSVTIGGSSSNNDASRSVIVGGQGNGTAFLSSYGVVVGGTQNETSGAFNSILGGTLNTASVSSYSVVTGGKSNSAQGEWSVVSGGLNRSTFGLYDWVAGTLFEDF